MEIVLNGQWTTKQSVIALGMFDGVHIGHQVLLERAAFLARRNGCPLVVCTFQRHPMELLHPDKSPSLLTTLPERQQLIENLGADVFFAMPFDHLAAEMLPEVYVGELVRRFHPTAVVCGYNHSFGKNAAGSPALLQVLGDALNFETSIVPAITLHGQDVSSSAIRQSLEEGNVRKAWEMLGRPYAVHGEIVKDGSLSIFSDGKQLVKDGSYRAVLCQDDRRHPVLVHQKGKVITGKMPQVTAGCAALEYLTSMQEQEFQKK